MSHISLSVLFYYCCQAFSRRLRWESRNGSAVAFPALQPCAGGSDGPGQGAQSTQVSLDMAVPTPHSLAFPELLPATDSFPAWLKPAAISSWGRGWWHSSTCACAFLPPCARGTLLFSLAWGGSVCSCWEKLSPAIWQRGRAGMRMSWDLRPTPHTVRPLETSQINVIK